MARDPHILILYTYTKHSASEVYCLAFGEDIYNSRASGSNGYVGSTVSCARHLITLHCFSLPSAVVGALLLHMNLHRREEIARRSVFSFVK